MATTGKGKQRRAPLERARAGALAEAKSLFAGAIEACREDDVETAKDLGTRGLTAIERAAAFTAPKSEETAAS